MSNKYLVIGINEQENIRESARQGTHEPRRVKVLAAFDVDDNRVVPVVQRYLNIEDGGTSKYGIYPLHSAMNLNVTNDHEGKITNVRTFEQEVSLDDDLFEMDQLKPPPSYPKAMGVKVIENVFVPYWIDEVRNSKKPSKNWENWYDLELLPLNQIGSDLVRIGEYYIVTDDLIVTEKKRKRSREPNESHKKRKGKKNPKGYKRSLKGGRRIRRSLRYKNK